MYAKTLARILGVLCQNSDVSYSTPQELDQRFEFMRRYGRLPRGGKRGDEKIELPARRFRSPSRSRFGTACLAWYSEILVTFERPIMQYALFIPRRGCAREAFMRTR